MNAKTDWEKLIERARLDVRTNPIVRWAINTYRDIAITGDPDAPCGICGRKDFHFHDDEAR